MLTFKYKEYDFRISQWNTDDFSDSVKGLVEVDTELGWIEVIEYKGFEGKDTLTLLDDNEITRQYIEFDYFVFNERHVLNFIKDHEHKVMELIKEEVGAM